MHRSGRRRRGLLLAMWVFHALLVFSSSGRSRAEDDGGGGGGEGGDGIIVTEANLAALLAIKHSFNDPQGALRSWNESGVGACSGSWSGIKCARGQVIAIQLPVKGLGGMISERVGELTELRKLNLHTNKIEGPIPASLAGLRSLRGVYLFQNRLSGTIPAGLGSSPLMQAIDLSSNGLQGDAPASLASSPRLFLLNLANNNLSGSVPAEWAASATLVTLILSGNAMSGPLPDTWGQSSSSSSSSSSPPRLRHMDLSGNRLVGGIPASLSNMVELDELHLQGNALEGSIPSRELSSLKLLRVIDLSRNRFNGSIPGTIGALSALSSIDLSHNQLSGPLPTSLGQLSNLTVLDLSDNGLAGGIPAGLGNASQLQLLDLSRNRLNGSIPGSLAGLQNLTSFNVSDNRLSGRVPAFVHPFTASAFAGNPGLCGFNGSSGAIISCPAASPPAKAPQQQQRGEPSSNNSRKNRLSKVSLICIILGGALALGAAVCMLMLVAWRFREQRAAAGRERTSKGKAEAAAAAGVTGAEGGAGGGNGNGKLVHFDGPFSFTADDLLCATAEVMGKSTYGTVYKATMENGNTVVVKRLREGIVRSQREFEVEVSALGRIRHANLVALRAYYWGPKDEKLLVYDFMNGGSLAAYLHARGPETPLGWSTRMKIALGAARGLAYLHDTEKMVHGNLTSSNILLDAHLNAVISDYGLSRLMTSSAGSTVLATTGSQGYRAPEVTKLKKATTKSDVYSFGIVLLELLTGKAPGDAVSTADGGALDLPEWVSSVVKEEWTSEVFDVELLKGAAPSEDDMLNTLQLAMNCVSASSSSRPDMAEVLRQVEAVATADHKSAASSGTASREG